MSLEEYINEYINITLKLIDNASNEKYLEVLFSQRNRILGNLISGDYDKKEIETKLKDANIDELENKLKKLIVKEKQDTKNKIDNIKKARVLKNAYDSFKGNNNFFSAKI